MTGTHDDQAKRRHAMESDDPTRSEDERREDEPAGETEGDGNAGPAEDIQNDPAYNPEDPELKGIKGG
jgi:hypothetical protein